VVNLAAERLKFEVDDRGSALRISPHLHNHDEDVDRLIGALGRA
jgi:selenocysteine lyase/cysteine desulfurase